MIETLDAEATSFAERIGITRACEAFGLKARSYRHRQQVKRDGRVERARDRAEKPVRRQHPAALSITEVERTLELPPKHRFIENAKRESLAWPVVAVMAWVVFYAMRTWYGDTPFASSGLIGEVVRGATPSKMPVLH